MGFAVVYVRASPEACACVMEHIELSGPLDIGADGDEDLVPGSWGCVPTG